MAPITAGATDTSTSNLVIQPGSVCLSRQFWKSMLGGLDENQEALTRLWLRHMMNSHTPPVVVPGLGVLVKLNVLASGAFGHEVSTSLTSFMVSLRCLQKFPPPWSEGPSEFLNSLNRSLPQGLTDAEQQGDLPSGISTAAFCIGGWKLLGMTMSPFPQMENNMLRYDKKVSIIVEKKIKGKSVLHHRGRGP